MNSATCGGIKGYGEVWVGMKSLFSADSSRRAKTVVSRSFGATPEKLIAASANEKTTCDEPRKSFARFSDLARRLLYIQGRRVEARRELFEAIKGIARTLLPEINIASHESLMNEGKSP